MARRAAALLLSALLMAAGFVLSPGAFPAAPAFAAQYYGETGPGTNNASTYANTTDAYRVALPTGDVQSLEVYHISVRTSATVKVALYAHDGATGNPTGGALGQCSGTASAVGWFACDPDVSVSAGTYWLMWIESPTSGGNTTSGLLLSYTPGQPDNALYYTCTAPFASFPGTIGTDCTAGSRANIKMAARVLVEEPTPTPTATNSATPTETNTPAPVTDTPTPTFTATPTATPCPGGCPTPTPTQTSVPGWTAAEVQEVRDGIATLAALVGVMAAASVASFFALLVGFFRR